MRGDRLREIAAMADELATERERINAPRDDGQPWRELVAWAARGDRYLEIVRAEPPEKVYRELLGEITRLEASAPGPGPGGA